jgi:hypothetical protein
VLNAGAGVPDGFIHRNWKGLITVWLAEGSMIVPQGNEITLFNGGDFWARTATAATVGQKVFASLTTGSIVTAAAGALVAGFIETKFVVRTPCLANELTKISAPVGG